MKKIFLSKATIYWYFRNLKFYVYFYTVCVLNCGISISFPLFCLLYTWNCLCVPRELRYHCHYLRVWVVRLHSCQWSLLGNCSFRKQTKSSGANESFLEDEACNYGACVGWPADILPVIGSMWWETVRFHKWWTEIEFRALFWKIGIRKYFRRIIMHFLQMFWFISPGGGVAMMQCPPWVE